MRCCPAHCHQQFPSAGPGGLGPIPPHGSGVRIPPSMPPPPVPAQPLHQHTSREAARSARAYDPTRADRSQPRGGRGRAHGAINYRPKEVQTLLDLIEDELPVGAKGWKVIGSRFRDWAVTAGYPARVDRSLELKFKQVNRTPCFCSDT